MGKPSINEKIYKTLRTKADKLARFMEELRDIGYDVENKHSGRGRRRRGVGGSE